MDDRNDEATREQPQDRQPDPKGEWRTGPPGDPRNGPQGAPRMAPPEDPRNPGSCRRKLWPGHLWAGLFMLLVGGVLLLDEMGFPLPDWLFSWHILLIAIGLFIGLRHNFRGGAWLVLILIGGCFLIQDFYPKTELHRFIVPCILILVGFLIIFRPKRAWRQQPWRDEWKHEWKDQWKDEWKQQWKHQWHQRWHGDWQQNRASWRHNPNRWHPGAPATGSHGQSTVPGSVPGGPTNYGGPGPNAGPNPVNGPTDPSVTSSNIPGTVPPGNPTGQTDAAGATNPTSQTAPGGFGSPADSGPYSSEDYIDTTSIFGGVHKKVVSKNFKGGDIVTFLGGSEIDLSQAEIYGTARLDVTQVMGGTKIIVPAHWEVRSEVTALFAGFEDKRQQPAMVNPNKVLIIDGTSIFGGIELKNF